MARNNNKGKGMGPNPSSLRARKNLIRLKEANRNRDLHFKQNNSK